jgi:hypothetical protein
MNVAAAEFVLTVAGLRSRQLVQPQWPAALSILRPASVARTCSMVSSAKQAVKLKGTPVPRREGAGVHALCKLDDEGRRRQDTGLLPAHGRRH